MGGKRRIGLTRRGERLLLDECAGELFAHLVAACFERLDLDSLGGPEWPALQGQIPYSLYQLSGRRPEWETAGELLLEIVAGEALDEAPDLEDESLSALLLEIRVLHLLEDFGLMESRPKPSSDEPPEMQYRSTPLLREFISFRI